MKKEVFIIELFDFESLYDLGDNMYIIQSEGFFKFGTDAVVLSDFCNIKNNYKIADLGTGTGIIPLLLYQRNNTSHIDAVEIDSDICAMASRSVLYNKLTDNINIINEDLKNMSLKKGVYDLVTSNPPYKPAGGGLVNKNEKAISARHEFNCTLEDVVSCGSALLRFGGCFCMVHKPERLSDIVSAFKKHGLEPKRLRVVLNKKNISSLILIEGRKGGNPSMTIDAIIK